VLSVVLALSASLTWGIADFLGGLKSRHLALLAVLGISQPIGVVGIGVLLAVRGTPPPEAGFVPFAVLSGVAGALAIAAFYHAMAIGTISIVAPIGATSAVIPVLAGVAMGERAAGAQVAGVLLAMAGVVLASRPDAAHDLGPGRRPRASAGFAMLAALGFGVFFVSLHRAAQDDVFWPAFVQRGTSSALLLACAAWRRAPLRVGWRHAPALATIGVLDVTANVCYAAASTIGLVSLASVLSSLYPVVTVVLARLVLDERLARPQQAGVVAALLGVALSALPR
jgi:drug/metabolite transporter (DMT)-like permease